MFTGIIEEVGNIHAIGGGSLVVRAKKVLEDVQIGDSIAVNGVCLTVTHFDSTSFAADVMPETVRRTSLAELKKGSLVNLERALTLSSRLGGHIVSGHIDGVGKIVSLEKEKNALLLTIGASSEILAYIVEKGSVALDGISLTVAKLQQDSFTVSLIPHTREVTNLRDKGAGSLINIENDVIGKYVQRLLQGKTQAQPQAASNITLDFLQNNGF